jgi:anti-anti-sigma regulatory factor
MNQPQLIDLAVSQDDGKVFLRIRGNLDGRTARRVEDVLQHLHGAPEDVLLSVDLSNMADFDYFGVVHLIKAIRDHRSRFQQVTVSGLKTSNENIFRRFGLESGKSSELALLAERLPGSKHHGEHPGR